MEAQIASGRPIVAGAMADNKRNSIAGKAATPKPAANANANSASATNDAEGALSKAIGARYVISKTSPYGL